MIGRFIKYFKKWNWSVFFFTVLVASLGAMAREDVPTKGVIFIILCFGIPIGLLWAWAAKDE